MARAVRNPGRTGLASYAVSAVDCALWDLKARLLELPLHKLLGAVRDRVAVYGSGGFTSYNGGQLRDQLEGWAQGQHIPRVKIKIGQDRGTNVPRDLAGIRQARAAIGPDTELFVDANGGYTAKQAVRVLTGAADEQRDLVRGASVQRPPGRAARSTAGRRGRRGSRRIRHGPVLLPAPLHRQRGGLPSGGREPVRRHQRVAARRRRGCRATAWRSPGTARPT